MRLSRPLRVETLTSVCTLSEIVGGHPLTLIHFTTLMSLTFVLPSTNLIVYHVILHLKRKLQLGEFFRIINNKPLACNLLESYCKQQDPELLKDFYYQDDRTVDRANLTLMESFRQKDSIEQINKIKAALRLYQDDKEHTFEAKVNISLEPSSYKVNVCRAHANKTSIFYFNDTIGD